MIALWSNVVVDEILSKVARHSGPCIAHKSLGLYNYLSLLIWFATLFMQDASL